MRVAGSEGLNKRRHILGDAMRQYGVVGCQNLGDAINGRCRRGDVAGGVSSDEDVDVAADFTGGGDGVQRGQRQLAVIVVCKDEDAMVRSPLLHFSVCSPSRYVGYLDPGLAGRWLFDAGNVQPRADIDPEIVGRHRIKRLFFAFMMFGSDA